MIDDKLLKGVTYAIVFLSVVIISIIVFIIKSRIDRKKIQKQKKKTEDNLSKKTVLLKEVHHRVKNNLQLVSGLIYLQSNKYKTPEIIDVLNDLQKHINSIALVHEMLYNEKTLSLVDMKKYLTELGGNILNLSESKKVNLNIDINDIYLPENYATTLGLIFNELITNSLKYAFEDNKGSILVSIEEINELSYKFEYKDDGIGMDLKEGKKKTLGLKLIRMFSEEIDADLKVKNENGLVYELNFQSDKNG